MDNSTTLQKQYYTVTDKEGVNKLIQHIQESETIAYDTETNSLNVRKGQIIGFSVSGDVGIGFYLPTKKYNPETDTLDKLTIEGVEADMIAKKLIGMLVGKKLVMHNASFDCRFTKNYYGVDLLPSLWVDTALLVHTVQEEGAGMGIFGLKPLAISVQEEIGLNVEEEANKEQIELKESIHANGGQTTKANYEIFKADLDILSKYAAADTDLTLRICYHFLGKLKEEGLEQFFFEDEVMPIYREVTVPMEEYGVDLDMDLIKKTREDIVTEMANRKETVVKAIMSTSAGREWVTTTALTTYPPNHKGSWAQLLCERYSLPLPKSDKTGKYSTTKKHLDTLEDSPVKHYLLTGESEPYYIDGKYQGDFPKDIDPLTCIAISGTIWKEKNDGEYINIQSKKHLGELVFNYFKVKPLTETTKGLAQFDEDMLKHLAEAGYEWAYHLRIYNKLVKIKSTYIDRFYDNAEDGRYYFYFKQNGTVSGRYGSDAQQLPKPKEEGEDDPVIVHYTNLVRAFLVAGKGRKVIDADYESLEPHCFASVTGDQALCDIFNNGHDFYSTVAIKTERLDEDRQKYPNGVVADKKADNYLKKLDPVKRQTAKSYSLGVAYGMSGYALGMTLGISTKEADALIDGYLNGFPGLKQWREDSRAFVKEHGYITNKVGRIRHLPNVKMLYALYGDGMLDWRFRRNELEPQYGKAQVDQWYRDYRNGLNNCLNYQLQSLAAAVVNRAAVKINRKLKELGVDARVQAQVHDQLLINVPEDKAEELGPIIQEIMETNLQLPGVTLKAPPEISDNWRDGH